MCVYVSMMRTEKPLQRSNFPDPTSSPHGQFWAISIGEVKFSPGICDILQPIKAACQEKSLKVKNKASILHSDGERISLFRPLESVLV